MFGWRRVGGLVLVAEARARFGTVLALSVNATGYFTVARKG
ncbi:hypothetical protein AB0C76_19365 [Kitasatospora sp. NPDC048722]